MARLRKLHPSDVTGHGSSMLQDPVRLKPPSSLADPPLRDPPSLRPGLGVGVTEVRARGKEGAAFARKLPAKWCFHRVFPRLAGWRNSTVPRDPSR